MANGVKDCYPDELQPNLQPDSISMLPAPDSRQQGAGYVVPDTEHRTGDGGRRAEMGHSQGHGQPGILHANFKGHGPATARRHVPQSRSPIPER